jgi:hypothetical protein
MAPGGWTSATSAGISSKASKQQAGQQLCWVQQQPQQRGMVASGDKPGLFSNSYFYSTK